jgi:hypothetical protein
VKTTQEATVASPCVADVETLNALRHSLKTERLLQYLEPITQAGAIVELPTGITECEFGEFHLATPQSARLTGDRTDFPALRENRLEPILLGHSVVKKPPRARACPGTTG